MICTHTLLLKVDGVALLVASLQFWLDQGAECPNVVVSTHFHSVIQQKLLPNTHMLEYLVSSLSALQ